MVQIKFPYILKTKAMILLSNLQTHFDSNLSHFLKQNSKHLQKRIIYPFINQQITGTRFQHAYCKHFSQLLIDDFTNLISLYTKHTLPSETPNPLPNTIHDTLIICLQIRMLKTVLNKFLDHSLTGLKIPSNIFSKYYYIPYLLILTSGNPFSYMDVWMDDTVLNVNALNTSI